MKRILFDFDGVWTDQAAEIVVIRRVFVQGAAERIGRTLAEAERDFARFYSLVLADPVRHGWYRRGVIAAFADEDELLATASVADWLDRSPRVEGVSDWREGILAAGFETVMDFAIAQFGVAMREARQGGHGLVEGAAEVLEVLRGRGAEISVVSNSPPEKLQALFGAVGVTEGEGLRLLGGARKWWVEDASQLTRLGGRNVHTDRPHYRAILAETQPDVVVGDVTSLDLALPAAMRSNGELGAGTELVLRRSAGTPNWATSQVELPVAERAVDRVIASVQELL